MSENSLAGIHPSCGRRRAPKGASPAAAQGVRRPAAHPPGELEGRISGPRHSAGGVPPCMRIRPGAAPGPDCVNSCLEIHSPGSRRHARRGGLARVEHWRGFAPGIAAEPLANPIRRPGPPPIRPPAMKCHSAAAFGPIPPPWGEPKRRVLPSGAAFWQFRPQLRRSACQFDNFFVNGPEMTSITAARPYQRACAEPGQTPIHVFGSAPKRRSPALGFAAPVAAGGGWGATAPAATGL